MEIPYTLLKSNTLVITLSTGPLTISPVNFNYWRIRTLVTKGCTDEAEVLNLIITLPEDHPVIFGFIYNDKLYYGTGDGARYPVIDSYISPIEKVEFLGPFYDLEDLKDQFPEYLL